MPEREPLNIAGLQTEQRNVRTNGLDRYSGIELIRLLHSENHTVAAAVAMATPEISQAVEHIAVSLQHGGRLFYVGAGTSGRLGVLDASECPPTFGVEPEMVQGIIAGGDTALRTSVEGAEDDPEAGAQDILAKGIQAQDVVVGLSASGRAPYVIGALRAAKEQGAYTIAVANASPAAVGEVADLLILAVTGPEVVTGSTRLKAGTAQKMILNLLSTGAMVRIGKTYGNLMVDVRATNAKLRDRAIRIVTTVAEVDHATAEATLEQCGWHAKTAIVALALGIPPEEAQQRLDDAHGFVRPVLHPAQD